MPRRAVSRNSVRREIIVFTEGLKTEVQYIQHWHRLNRESVLVTIDDFHGAPLPLVQRAVERRNTDRRAERKGHGTAPDETWCIFDTDQHPSIPEALDLAARNGVSVAISNPCLELWFLLHFQDQTAWIHRHAVQAVARKYLSAGKSLTPGDLGKLTVLHDSARARAMALAQIHQGNGNSATANPSSDVWRLVDSIARRR